MRKNFVQIAAFLLALLIIPGTVAGAEPAEGESDPAEVAQVDLAFGEDDVRVGLYYGSDALPGANLLNSVGTGYRFGYDDGAGFCQLGITAETAISMVKTQNVYYVRFSDGLSGYTDQSTSNIVVGCYHIGLPGRYATFEEAKAAADPVGGFPAWIKGEFQVRIGAYASAGAAESALQSLGVAEASVVGTSSYGITVVKTGTAAPIFQFDGGAENAMLIVKPGMDDSVKAITHFKKRQYYGSFRYERIEGGNLTVVNLVSMDDYVRGILPYEMSSSWPLEALKAQAVCARSYTVTNMDAHRHSSSHFDICTTTHCQVYKGTESANANTDRAVEETAGQYAWYDGKIIEAYYHSSDGGATENIENVWNEALPYLRGVVDPYEALIENEIPSYHWTRTYTGRELKEMVAVYDYNCSDIVDIKVSKLTDTGNVYSVTFTDKNGKSWTVTKDSRLRSMFGTKSLRYTITPGGDGYSLTDNQSLGALNGAWALDKEGNPVKVNVTTVYALTGNGVEEVKTPENTDGTFTFSGTGNGHNLGMSQWGAYSMAKQGYTYDEILKFYYTGIEIHE